MFYNPKPKLNISPDHNLKLKIYSALTLKTNPKPKDPRGAQSTMGTTMINMRSLGKCSLQQQFRFYKLGLLQQM